MNAHCRNAAQGVHRYGWAMGSVPTASHLSRNLLTGTPAILANKKLPSASLPLPRTCAPATQDKPPLPWLAFATPRPGVHGPGPALLRGKRKQAAGTGRGAGQVDAGAGAEAGTGGAIAESDGSNGTSGRGRRRRGRGPEAERPGGDGGGPEERTDVGTSSQAAG